PSCALMTMAKIVMNGRARRKRTAAPKISIALFRNAPTPLRGGATNDCWISACLAEACTLYALAARLAARKFFAISSYIAMVAAAVLLQEKFCDRCNAARFQYDCS